MVAPGGALHPLHPWTTCVGATRGSPTPGMEALNG